MSNFTYDEYRKRLAEDGHAIERAVETIRKVVKTRGPRAVQAEIAAVQPHQPVDRAIYKRAFRFEDIPGGATMYNFAKHAPIIEGGRRPGARMPPVDVIFEWVKRHHIGETLIGPVQQQFGPRRQGKQKTDRRAAIERQQWHIALNIARKIRARGLPARFILHSASVVVDKAIHAAISGEKAA